MSEMRISRAESPITLDEWIAAVNKVDGIRLTGGNTPRHAHSGNAEVFSPKFTEWVSAFRWLKTGEAAFKPDTEGTGSPVMRAALQLAAELHARVIDGDGAQVSGR